MRRHLWFIDRTRLAVGEDSLEFDEAAKVWSDNDGNVYLLGDTCFGDGDEAYARAEGKRLARDLDRAFATAIPAALRVSDLLG